MPATLEANEDDKQGDVFIQGKTVGIVCCVCGVMRFAQELWMTHNYYFLSPKVCLRS